MRFVHISDLHIGKKLNEFDLLDDQKHILFSELIGRIIADEKPDGIVIAGDIYDRSSPSSEAIKLFDDFLTKLSQLGLYVFVISGNHDSSEKISYGSRILQNNNIFISEEFDGKAKKVTVNDEFGEINFFLLPFIRAVQVKSFYPDSEIKSYTDAIRVVLENSKIDYEKRNIILSHQFVIGTGDNMPEQCESESIYVGGIDQVSYTVFDGFDYVALGHIHGPQFVGREEVRYCGTLLKYSASEALHKKSVTVVEIGEKGSVSIKKSELNPLRELKVISGTLDEILTANKNSFDENSLVYVNIRDRGVVVDVMPKLRTCFKNVLNVKYTDFIFDSVTSKNAAERIEHKTPVDLFSDFYLLRKGVQIDEERIRIVSEIFEAMGGENR